MGMIDIYTWKCKSCGYVFEGFSGISDSGGFRCIAPYYCHKCHNVTNVSKPELFSIRENQICEKCKEKMKPLIPHELIIELEHKYRWENSGIITLSELLPSETKKQNKYVIICPICNKKELFLEKLCINIRT